METKPDAAVDREAMSELKPCPFCGKEGELRSGYWGGPNGPEMFVVDCEPCKDESYTFRTKEAAVTAWNRRNPATMPDNPAGAAVALARLFAKYHRQIPLHMLVYAGLYGEDVNLTPAGKAALKLAEG